MKNIRLVELEQEDLFRLYLNVWFKFQTTFILRVFPFVNQHLANTEHSNYL